MSDQPTDQRTTRPLELLGAAKNNGGARRLRVCYQRGLPSLVLTHWPGYLLENKDKNGIGSPVARGNFISASKICPGSSDLLCGTSKISPGLSVFFLKGMTTSNLNILL